MLVDAYRSGTPNDELATRFDVHRPTVRGVLARRDVPRRYRKLGPEGLAEDRRLYESGWSFARVGAELGVDLKAIHSAFK